MGAQISQLNFTAYSTHFGVCSGGVFDTATSLLINNKTKMIDFFYHKKHVQALHKRIALLEQRISLQDKAITELENQNMRLLDHIFEIEEFWC